MLTKNESAILKIIKYSPFLLISFLSITTIYVMYLEKNIQYETEINNLQKSFTVKSKKKIEKEVTSVLNYILYEKNSSEEQLKKEMKNRVDEVIKVIDYLYLKYKDKESKDELILRIKDTLRQYRFNDGRGYFYIYEKTGKNVLLPTHPHLEGNDFWNHKDSKGSFVIQDMIDLLKNKDEDFYEWYWYKPNDKTKMRKKVGIVKNIKYFDWFIGTAEYIDNFEEALKTKVLKYINSLKYEKNGYVFIIDFRGVYLAHIKEEYIGLNRIDLTDKNGVEITQRIIDIAKDGEGYISYVGTIKPETKLPASKTTYVKGLKDWQWAIGTGYYEDEFEKQIEEKIKDIDEKYENDIINLLGISISLTLIFLILSFYTSIRLEKVFKEYRTQILRKIDENRKKDLMLAQQAKMAAMGEMLGNIAHQWRQPLNTISTLSSGVKLNKELGILSDKELISTMENIGNSTQYLSQTIDDFREFFNPNKKMQRVDIKNSFEKVFTLLESQLKSNNIQVIKIVPSLHLLTYENELIQVLINIINNAKDQLVKSEIKTRIVVVEVVQKEEEIVILIKDNAGGIDESIMNRIFEPYFTTKHKSQGTGIGLYMSREIIVKHLNGDIEVNNENIVYNDEEFVGAKFKIILNTKH